MISKTSRKCYKAVVIACSMFNLIPYILDKKPEKKYRNMETVFLQISPRIRWYKLYVAVNRVILASTIIILIRQIYTQNLSPPIVLSLLGFFAILFIVGGAQIFLCLGYETLLPALNSVFILQYRLGQMYKVTNKKDGLEKFLPILNLASAGIFILIFPANLFLLQSNHPVVRGVFATPYLVVNIGFSISTAVSAQVNTAAILFMIYFTVFHLNAEQLWMEYLKWTPECTEKVKDNNRIAYRALKLSNIIAHNNCRPAIAYVYSVNIVLQIALIFFVIRLFDTMPFFAGAGFCVVLLCLFVTEFCIRSSLAIEDSSIQCSESFLRNDFSLRPVDRAFFKSCSPIRVEVGTFFVISGSAFYLELYQNIIIAYVTDLLISY